MPLAVIASSGDRHRTQQEIPVNDHTPLLTREEVGFEIYGEISELLERGYSQSLGRKQALQVAAWALRIAGERELQHQVLAELVELPEDLG